MSRPTTKQDLIEAASTQFDKIWKMIGRMSEVEQNAPFDFDENFLQKQKAAHWVRDKNLRDVLIHLYEWHQLLLNWVKSNQNKEAKAFLPAPYNWKTYPQMNVWFWEKHQSTTYAKSQKMLKDSHAEVMALIETLSNDELFAKNHFSWTGTSTLGSYCVSTTSSHYDWAITKIKQYIKSYKS
ncbi:MAG: ClbS/DfsB family four-helix bundle protein [Campylobacteraceae bacterium]|jgi:hypothetical protein|nr:ClbS/DfsB family four-helix bundle protein [Campylobacteraceae bacterium]